MYDEPTAGLDPVASTVVEDLIRYRDLPMHGIYDCPYQCVHTRIVTVHATVDLGNWLSDCEFTGHCTLAPMVGTRLQAASRPTSSSRTSTPPYGVPLTGA